MALTLRLQVEGITKEFPVGYFLMQQVLPGVVDRALPRMIGSMNSSLPTQKKSMLLLLSMLEEKGLQNLIVCSRPSCRTGTRRSCYESSLFDLIKAAIKTMVTAMVKDIN